MNNMVPLLPFFVEECGPVSLFEVDVWLSGDGQLGLHYIVDAKPEGVVMAACHAPVRADGLWRSTCFEVFVRHESGPEYLEFNFAPSQLWAAYHFAGYRDGMVDLPMMNPPQIYLTTGESWFSLEANVQLPDGWCGQTLCANVTAVIESIAGHKSYWAAKHASGQPDFHDPDCFVVPLGAGEAP